MRLAETLKNYDIQFWYDKMIVSPHGALSNFAHFKENAKIKNFC